MADSAKPTTAAPTGKPLWNAQDPMGSLAELYGLTLEKGQVQINWYRAKVRPKRFGSQACRFLAILLFGLAALIPLLKAAGIWQGTPNTPSSQIFELGYIAAALAAGCIAFDRYFGLSTAWIRFIQTELALEGALDELRYDWVALLSKTQGETPAPEQIQAMIQRLRAFVVLANSQTLQETQAWIMEFQTNLADLEKSAKLRAQEQKPGTLELTVSNAPDFDAGVTASLDGMEARHVEGKSCVFPSVAPGTHIVLVKGAKSGRAFQSSEIVRVQPDSVSQISVALPTA